MFARSVASDTTAERMPGVELREDSMEETQAPHLEVSRHQLESI